MQVFTIKSDLQPVLDKLRETQKSIGFVPTMGALHDGHLSLVQQSLKQTDFTVVSIFVNPTQFNNAADLTNYPRTLERDLLKLSSLNASNILVYAPETNDVYGSVITSVDFEFGGLEHQMEGKFRPGHFNGVGTIVKFLFELIQPQIAFFGEKDFQQALIVSKLAEMLENGPTIEIVPIFREANGLAMSSRNERLTAEQREKASLIFESLSQAKVLFKTESFDRIKETVQSIFSNHPLFQLEYFEIADAQTLESAAVLEPDRKYRAFIAVFADDVRLIDTISLN
ncbi:pantoate--beta-alanine ligase [Flavobacterium aurantiibacter]|uniref:Pantothenate synthetase n=1 Tax=Flavobacterium aurantiibacter TaxID=2023067 RepID=A0A255ZQA6_9FLAO|nr:pantoate--beta-alanine ligase [Flavobacterium aurantiibacter]OYQ43646.1 pantoate--beta-alanine ligase [Flavobacterium aurantiibacter]